MACSTLIKSDQPIHHPSVSDSELLFATRLLRVKPMPFGLLRSLRKIVDEYTRPCRSNCFDFGWRSLAALSISIGTKLGFADAALHRFLDQRSCLVYCFINDSASAQVISVRANYSPFVRFLPPNSRLMP